MKNYFRWLSPTRTRSASSQPGSETVEQKSAGMTSMFAMAGNRPASWSQSDYATMARKGFMANPVVYRCVRMISQTAAAVPLLLYQDVQELDKHPVLDLLARPNERQGGKDFFEMIFGHLLVSGNAYVELVNVGDNPRELHCLRPDRVRILNDRQGWCEGYEYSTGNTKKRYRIDEQGVSPILHLSLFHPLDDQQGFPPLQAALTALDVHNSSNQWNKSLLDNSARPSGAPVYPSSNSPFSRENCSSDKLLPAADE